MNNTNKQKKYMNKHKFKLEIDNFVNNEMPKEWRKGQGVFNYIDANYGVAREVQFIDGIDCFYDNSEIENFIDACWKRIQKSSNLEIE